MNIVLEKDGQSVSYKMGEAYYILFGIIPFIGSLILIFLTISRKQFKGVWLNSFLISLILGLFTTIAYASGSAAVSTIVSLVITVIYTIVYIIYIFNANTYSVKARLAEGYRVTSVIDNQTQVFLDKVERTKFPIYQIVKF